MSFGLFYYANERRVTDLVDIGVRVFRDRDLVEMGVRDFRDRDLGVYGVRDLGKVRGSEDG